MNILIVDDSADNRDMLSFILSADGFDITISCNGKEAVESVKQQTPDLILMDVLMPEMDGYEATMAIREYLGDTHIPILFLTGLTDDDTLSKCLSVGGDDFLYKPITHQVLKAKIKAHKRIRDLTLQLKRKNKALRLAQKQNEAEQKIAKALFERVMDESSYSSESVKSFMVPAEIFSGDMTLTARSPSGSLYVLLADFTGHGLPAAVGTIPVSQMFFEGVGQSQSVADMARKLNKSLESFLPDEMFAAAIIIELNYLGNRAIIWSGGLPPIVVTGPTGKLKQLHKSQHLALGIAKDSEFKPEVKILNLEPMDKLYLYTDGLIDARGASGELYGIDRVLSFFDGTFEDPFEQIIEDNLIFQVGSEQKDDISLIEICCEARSQSKPFVPELHPNDQLPWSLCMDLGPKELRQRPPVPLLADMLTVTPGLYPYKDALQTVLTELFANALEHGVLGISSCLKGGEDGYFKYYEVRSEKLQALETGFIKLNADYRFEHEQGALTLTIEDSGHGFSPNIGDGKEKNDESGRGLMLVKQLTDGVEFNEAGNKVTIRLKARFREREGTG
mgnify:CR=1 FL=1